MAIVGSPLDGLVCARHAQRGAPVRLGGGYWRGVHHQAFTHPLAVCNGRSFVRQRPLWRTLHSPETAAFKALGGAKQPLRRWKNL
nr:hypothetical protein [uncultured Pseudomonas sp.]